MSVSHEVKKLNALLSINETLEKILQSLNELKDMSDIVDELKELNSKKNIQMSVLHDYNINVETEEQQPSQSFLRPPTPTPSSPRPPTPRPPIEQQEPQLLTIDDVEEENIISE